MNSRRCGSVVHIRLGVADILVKRLNIIRWEVHHEMMIRLISGDKREHLVQFCGLAFCSCICLLESSKIFVCGS